MPPRTNPFQQLCASIVAVFHGMGYIVDESVGEVDLDTGRVREVDIKVRSRTDPEDTVMVECKDEGRPLTVEWIEQLDGKAKSFKFRKVVAVSNSGFTAAALAKAKKRGIETLTVKEAEEKDWRKWQLGLRELGIELHYLEIVDVRLEAAEGFPPDRVPKNMDSEMALLVDRRNGSTTRLKDWLVHFQNHPRVREQLDRQKQKDGLDVHEYGVRCKGIGVQPNAGAEIMPLSLIVVTLRHRSDKTSVALDHWDAGGERIQEGKLGPHGKVLTREVPGVFTVMFEQRIPVDGAAAGGTPKKGSRGRKKNGKNGRGNANSGSPSP